MTIKKDIILKKKIENVLIMVQKTIKQSKQSNLKINYKDCAKISRSKIYPYLQTEGIQANKQDTDHLDEIAHILFIHIIFTLN